MMQELQARTPPALAACFPRLLTHTLHQAFPPLSLPTFLCALTQIPGAEVRGLSQAGEAPHRSRAGVVICGKMMRV